MMWLLPALVLAALALPALSMRATDSAVRCSAHPAYTRSLTPVLISSWTYELSSPNTQHLAYLPRYTGHTYAPVTDRQSSMFRGLDLFHTANFRRATSFRVTFQRAAVVYLLVDVPDDMFQPERNVSLRGWRSVGWVERVQGAGTIEYGVQERLRRSMARYAYAFARDTGGSDFVDVPQSDFIVQRISMLQVQGSFNLLVAEADGSPSPAVGSFRGMQIRANTRCPDALHDTWMVEDDNEDDADTRGVKFHSWHPAWDPCFWCAYDHEHGSSPYHLMRYKPKFTYTAWKNDRQNEGDAGFKGYVLRSGEHLLYLSLHVTQSSLRRVSVSKHTINLAIVHRRTKELLVDLQHKGDFGFAAVRLLGNREFRPIFPGDQAIFEAQAAAGLPESFRMLNILDLDNPDPELEIREPFRIGQYEEWQTLPMCSRPRSRESLLNMQFKLPNTGLKSAAQADVVTDLGRTIGGHFFKSVGLNRSIKAKRLQIAHTFCPGGASGVFYTDVDGKRVFDAPGPDRVRQFFKRGFSLTLTGRFEVVEPWAGLHVKGARGFFSDHGYGINADLN